MWMCRQGKQADTDAEEARACEVDGRVSARDCECGCVVEASEMLGKAGDNETKCEGTLMDVRTCAVEMKEGGVGGRCVAERVKHVRGRGKGKEQWLSGESAVL